MGQGSRALCSAEGGDEGAWWYCSGSGMQRMRMCSKALKRKTIRSSQVLGGSVMFAGKR